MDGLMANVFVIGLGHQRAGRNDAGGTFPSDFRTLRSWRYVAMRAFAFVSETRKEAEHALLVWAEWRDYSFFNQYFIHGAFPGIGASTTF